MMCSTTKTSTSVATASRNEVDAETPVRAVQRGGHVLSWSNLNVTLHENKWEVGRRILQNIDGEAIPGEPTAILGPSGAGKTTLFSVLTGKVGVSSARKDKLRVEKGARVLLDGKPINHKVARESIAYVPQVDALPASSTPREAIWFSARLRLPKDTTSEEIDKLTEEMIEYLGLSECADTVIGSGLTKGLSGGEKKRTSIGIELVVGPRVILLDEPTSGLDAYSASQVVKVLNNVAAKSNTTVLFTVHQPSSEVFNSIPRYIIMNKGRILCQGLTKDISSDFEAKYGCPIPPHYNPAEFAVNIAQKESDEALEKYGFYSSSEANVADDLQDVEKGMPSTLATAVNDDGAGRRVSAWRELSMLMLREKRNLLRCTEPMITNVSVTLALSLVYGIFFWQVGSLDRENETNVQAIQGTLQNIQISTMLSQHSYALMTLPTERPLFLREYSTNHYGTIPYFLSKLSAEALQTFVAILVQSIVTYYMIGFELPFLIFFGVNFGLAMTVTAIAVLIGALVSNLSSVTDLYALATVPQFFFSGVFAPIDVIPVFVRWAQYLCSLKYAASLAMIYEFGSCGSDLAQRNCDILLERNDVQPEDEWWYWLALLGLFCLLRTLALLAIKKRTTVHK